MSFYKDNKKIIDMYNCSQSIDVCLKLLRPNASWAVIDNIIKWDSKEPQTQPTDEELNDVKKKLIEIYPMFQLRKKRNQLLEETDIFFNIFDYPIDDIKKEELKTYRRYLRDLPNVLEDNNINIDINNLESYFPIKPI